MLHDADADWEHRLAQAVATFGHRALHPWQRAVLQALDLQAMRGTGASLPVLFTETGGLALASTDLVREQTGLNAHGERIVLLLSSQEQAIQLLQHI